MGQMEDISSLKAAGTNEFLTFRLGGEEYGIDILTVKEIRGHDPVTRIANSPTFIKGVINLRGTIVPVVDLRHKFNLEHAADQRQSVVIILNVAQRVVGVVVDSVSDVIALTAEQIKPAPEFGGGLATDFIRGLGSIDGRMLIMVDIEKLMTSADMSLFDIAHG